MTWNSIEEIVKPHYQQFNEACQHVKIVQDRFLNNLVERQLKTEMAKKYSFEKISDYFAFKSKMPLSQYKDIAKDIKRCAQGEKNIFTAEEIFLFEITSGTTSEPKLIPYTQRSLRSFQKALFCWFADLLIKYPKIKDGKLYFSISPVVREKSFTSNGIPIGEDDDSHYFGEKVGQVVKANTLDLQNSQFITNFDKWKKVTAKILLEAKDISFISIWSPTFLLELVKEIEILEPQFNAAIAWPKLALISCWTSASSSYFSQKLHDHFPQASMQGKGLISTEAIVSFPFSWGENPVLAIESNFYEFLCDDGNIYRAHQLKEGESYEVVISNYSGLYRYRTADKVIVSGFYHQAPQICFIGKNENYSDLCGEKLCEDFVSSCFKRIGLAQDGTAFLLPLKELKPGYCLLFEKNIYDHEKLLHYTAELELSLQDNVQYRYARNLGQLNEMTFRESSNLLDLYYANALTSGKRFGDIKPSIFITVNAENYCDVK